MKRSRLWLASLILAILCTLLVPLSVAGEDPAAAPRQLEGIWQIDVHWYDPESTGTYGMNVTMHTPYLGSIDTGTHTGWLLTNGERVLWTVDQPWVAIYIGTVSTGSMAGSMFNKEGRHGTWTGVQTVASEIPSLPGIVTGVAGTD
jgi:hypothetical protein